MSSDLVKIKVLFIIETSDNVGQEGIYLLNKAIQTAVADLRVTYPDPETSVDWENIKGSVDCAVLCFASQARLITKGFVNVIDLNPSDLVAGGQANFGKACTMLNEHLENKVIDLDSGSGSIIFLLANGNFTDDWKKPFAQLGEKIERPLKYAFYFGRGSDHNTLEVFAANRTDYGPSCSPVPQQVFPSNKPSRVAAQISACVDKYVAEIYNFDQMMNADRI